MATVKPKEMVGSSTESAPTKKITNPSSTTTPVKADAGTSAGLDVANTATPTTEIKPQTIGASSVDKSGQISTTPPVAAKTESLEEVQQRLQPQFESDLKATTETIDAQQNVLEEGAKTSLSLMEQQRIADERRADESIALRQEITQQSKDDILALAELDRQQSELNRNRTVARLEKEKAKSEAITASQVASRQRHNDLQQARAMTLSGLREGSFGSSAVSGNFGLLLEEGESAINALQMQGNDILAGYNDDITYAEEDYTYSLEKINTQAQSSLNSLNNELMVAINEVEQREYESEQQRQQAELDVVNSYAQQSAAIQAQKQQAVIDAQERFKQNANNVYQAKMQDNAFQMNNAWQKYNSDLSVLQYNAATAATNKQLELDEIARKDELDYERQQTVKSWEDLNRKFDLNKKYTEAQIAAMSPDDSDILENLETQLGIDFNDMGIEKVRDLKGLFGSTEATFENLPAGSYSIPMFHSDSVIKKEEIIKSTPDVILSGEVDEKVRDAVGAPRWIKYNDQLDDFIAKSAGNELFLKAMNDSSKGITRKGDELNSVTGLDKMLRVKELIEDNGVDFTGPADSIANEMNTRFGNTTGEEFAEINNLLKQALTAKVKDLSGAQVSDKEREFIQDFMASPNQFDAKFITNFQTYLTEVERNVDARMKHWGFNKYEEPLEQYRYAITGSSDNPFGKVTEADMDADIDLYDDLEEEQSLQDIGNGVDFTPSRFFTT